MFKRLFLLFFIVLIVSSVIFADEFISGPYDLEEGLKQYSLQTGKTVYDPKNIFFPEWEGQCTWFCAAVTKKFICKKSAKYWLDGQENTGMDPKENAICVWGPTTSNPEGHVAKVVEVIDSQTFIVWESNYINWFSSSDVPMICCRKVTSLNNILGFIYVNEPTSSLEVVETHPEQNEEIYANDKAWIVFNNKLPENYLDHIEVNSDSKISIYDLYSQERNLGTIIFKDFLPGDEVSIRIKREIGLENDFVFNFKIKEQNLISTGPDSSLINYSLQKTIPIKNWGGDFGGFGISSDGSIWYSYGNILCQVDSRGEVHKYFNIGKNCSQVKTYLFAMDRNFSTIYIAASFFDKELNDYNKAIFSFFPFRKGKMPDIGLNMGELISGKNFFYLIGRKDGEYLIVKLTKDFSEVARADCQKSPILKEICVATCGAVDVQDNFYLNIQPEYGLPYIVRFDNSLDSPKIVYDYKGNCDERYLIINDIFIDNNNYLYVVARDRWQKFQIQPDSLKLVFEQKIEYQSYPRRKVFIGSTGKVFVLNKNTISVFYGQ